MDAEKMFNYSLIFRGLFKRKKILFFFDFIFSAAIMHYYGKSMIM